MRESVLQQTECGRIPSDWEVSSLGSITTLMTNGFVGKAKSHYTTSKDGVLYIQGYNVKENSFDFHGIKYVTRDFHNSHQKSNLQCGDLLTVQTGEVGLTTIVPESLAGSNCHALIISRFNKKKASSRFVSYYMNSQPGRARLRLIETGTTMKHLNVGDMLEFVVPLPPTLAEQEVIAKALSDTDAYIASLEQLIAKKRSIKKGVMQELLTGKRRLPGFSGEWSEYQLGKSAILKARIGWQGLTTSEYKDSGDFYLVTGTEFQDGFIDWNECHYVDASRYVQDKNIQLSLKDILVTKDGTIGKVAFVHDLPKPATLNSGVFVIRPIQAAFHPKFFYYLLSSSVFAQFLNQLSAGSTINHLYQKDFVNFRYMLPVEIEEQQAIAQILADIDHELRNLEEKLIKARQVKQGMMQELLTGRIRLL